MRPKTEVYVNSRGIGSEGGLNCFCCGEPQSLASNIAAFVDSKEDGEDAVAMFISGAARLYPIRFGCSVIQVKIGACDAHFSQLTALHKLFVATNTLSKQVIDRSRV